MLLISENCQHSSTLEILNKMINEDNFSHLKLKFEFESVLQGQSLPINVVAYR